MYSIGVGTFVRIERTRWRYFTLGSTVVHSSLPSSRKNRTLGFRFFVTLIARRYGRLFASVLINIVFLRESAFSVTLKATHVRCSQDQYGNILTLRYHRATSAPTVTHIVLRPEYFKYYYWR